MTPADLINLTNAYRAEQGLSPLKVNQQLMQAAQYRAEDLAKTRHFSHEVATTTPEMKQWSGFLKNKGYNYSYAGENLARNFSKPEDVLTGWKNSPKHNENLIHKDYKEIGMAAVPNGKGGYYVVQHFGTPIRTSQKPQQVKAPQTNTAPQQRLSRNTPLFVTMDTRVHNSTPMTFSK